MVPPLETYVVVSLAFAVFAAVTSIGAAIVLGVGYERLRAGLERVKEGLDVINRQTGFFSTAIFKLENKVDTMQMGGQMGRAPTVISDEPKAPSKRKSRAKKSTVDELPGTTLTGTEAGAINVSVPLNMSGDWQSYQGMSKDEALANFAQLSNKGDGKIKFM